MMRLAKYLKPFVILLLLSVILLFGQAMADLALPDYTSDIVNQAIQQGGIESAVPDAMRQSTMNRLSLFLSADNKAQVLAAYTLVEQNSSDYDQYLEQYPALADAPIYVLNATGKDQIAELNPILGKALLSVAAIEQIMADPSKAASTGMTTGFDLSQVPAGTDLFAMLAKLPAAQQSQILAGIDEKFSDMDDSLIVQSAVSVIKAEYTALGMDTDKLQSNYILRAGLNMLLLSLASAACAVIVGYLSARTAAGLARNLRRLVFRKVESFANAEFDKFSTASLITRTTNDITQLQMVVVMLVRMVVYAPLLGVGGVIRALSKGASMWWIIAAAVGLLIGLIVAMFTTTLPRFKVIQSLIDRLNLVTRENLSGMMVIRAFNRQDSELARFDKANKDLTGTMLFVNRVMVVMMPAMMLIMNGLMLAIIWVGAHQVADLNMQVGDMMAFMQYAMQIVMAFLMLSIMFIIVPRSSVSASRIADVLETEASIVDPQEPKTFPSPFKGTVEFRNVSFRYPGAEEDVLHDISFTSQPGQTTAFIGTTGSGKSTLVNLIPRFYDVTGGAIYVDGTDIRQVTQHDLRDKIGLIPQKSTLFAGTIESTLRYADENAAEETLQTATDIAQASKFIAEKEGGMASEIAQGGSNVSGGQKQRLAIARALVKKAPIYIFDDSFSNLDFKTDSALRKALKEYTRSSTVMIVTQRISTIMNAEQIIVLDAGQIVGKGTHTELMQTCETYRGIALSQLSKEELA